MRDSTVFTLCCFLLQKSEDIKAKHATSIPIYNILVVYYYYTCNYNMLKALISVIVATCLHVWLVFCHAS